MTGAPLLVLLIGQARPLSALLDGYTFITLSCALMKKKRGGYCGRIEIGIIREHSQKVEPI